MKYKSPNIRMIILIFILLTALLLLTSCDTYKNRLNATVSSGISQTQTIIVATEQSIQTADMKTLVAAYTATSTETLTATPTVPSPTPTLTDTVTPSLSPSLTYTVTPSPLPTLTPTIELYGTASVRYSNTNIRYGPSAEYPVITKLDAGTEVSLLGQSEGGQWIVILMQDGKEGWVSSELLAFIAEPEILPIFERPPTPVLYRVTIINTDFIPSYLVHGPHGSIELAPDSSITINLPEGEYEIQICDWFNTSKCGVPVPFEVKSNITLSLKRIFSVNSAYKP